MTRQRTTRARARRRNFTMGWMRREADRLLKSEYKPSYTRPPLSKMPKVKRTRTRDETGGAEDMATLNAIAKQHAGKSFKSLRRDEQALVRSLAERMQNPASGDLERLARNYAESLKRHPEGRRKAKAGLRRLRKQLEEHRDWLRSKGYEDDGVAQKLENNIRFQELALQMSENPGPPLRSTAKDALSLYDKGVKTTYDWTAGLPSRIAHSLLENPMGHESHCSCNPALRISGKDPATMTAGEVNKELDRLYKIDSQLTDEMISAGRGHERPSDYWPPKPGDTLAEQKRQVYDRMSALRWQIEKEYGPGAPSRFPSGWRRSLKKNPKTKLELILDQVVAGKREVTFDVHGYTEEQKKRIIDAAHERGLHASGGGDHILVRDLRNMQRNSRRNPESGADRMYEIFHGRPPQTDVIVEEEIHEHEHLATLGPLVSLKVETRSGYSVEIGWDDEDFHPYLACNEQGNQLYIEGGDQSIDLASFKMDGAKWLKDMMVIGDLVETTYRTEKDFDNFESIDYYHANGEESGEVPQLIYDPNSKADKDSKPGKLYIAGGKYRIEHDGIID